MFVSDALRQPIVSVVVAFGTAAATAVAACEEELEASASKLESRVAAAEKRIDALEGAAAASARSGCACRARARACNPRWVLPSLGLLVVLRLRHGLFGWR